MNEKGKPYTDVFVISHGWNFTALEAISNYHNYIHALENHLLKSQQENFRPYFIFIVWNSVSRPLTSASQSILPYGLADFIKLPAEIIDGAFFHIPSGWKESINAYHTALGRDLPVSYMDSENSREMNYEDGRDIPVSEILYKILNKNENEKSGTIKPKIHVIGHSYGAKLIALATLAALDKYEDKNSIDSGSYLESMILFNAAFHPLELHYSDHGKLFIPPEDIERHFKKIQRKAIVFSNTDYATGFLFGSGQIILNSKQSQMINALLNHAVQDKGLFSLIPEEVIKYVGIPIAGGLQLLWNVGTSVGEWSLRSVIQLPTEWLHHVENNDTFYGAFGNNLLSKILNSVHYFIPLDKFNEDVDQQGIFRTTLPALGRSGLHNNAKGHILNFLNLGGMKGFVLDENENPRAETLIDASTFAKMACSTDWQEGSEFQNPNLMYSFDASKVFDTWLSPAGSHGDIRSSDEIVYCVENRLSTTAPQKIEGTFNFVLKFINGLKERPQVQGALP
ncbi:MAG: hypothetical protein Q7U77_11670, partial [Sediminibacterium sp.]